MVTLTQKCQVTIPAYIRSIIGIGYGDEVEFMLERGKVYLKKKKKTLPFDRWKGYLGEISSDKAVKELR